MTSNVTPSTPGAPLFFLANVYASRSVSILQIWTYKPQKRHDGSAFALTYMFLLRSCKLIGVFVIHLCLPFCWNRYKQQGPFAPPALPGFIAVGSEVAHPVSPMLATVRRSNWTCGFPASSFHEDSCFRDAIEGIS